MVVFSAIDHILMLIVCTESLIYLKYILVEKGQLITLEEFQNITFELVSYLQLNISDK